MVGVAFVGDVRSCVGRVEERDVILHRFRVSSETPASLLPGDSGDDDFPLSTDETARSSELLRLLSRGKRGYFGRRIPKKRGK